MSALVFTYLMYSWIALALIMFPVMLFIPAPYGRHTSRNWGPVMVNRLGWMMMESLSLIAFVIFFILSPEEKSLPLWIMFGLWVAHYVNRSIIFPLRIRTSGKVIPVLIVALGIIFNAINGWSNGWYLGSGLGNYQLSWLSDPRFISGLIIFLLGAWINISSDNILLRLRTKTETGYKIPHGKMFKYISCPNHFGETLQWCGFAVLCWNLPALAFAIWTAANLLPRAIAHHKWYRETFPDFPKDRKAFLPFLL